MLVAFYDLFRTGHLSWGWDFANSDPPKCQLTEQGRRALQHLSRDPSNPDGYFAHLASRATLNPIAGSYVDEALRAYNNDCFRAAAVMIGAAAESMILELRDIVEAGIKKQGRTPAKELAHHLIKRVLDALQKELQMQQRHMPTDLREAFDAYWSAFTQQIRTARNDAGHPASIAPVTSDTVHASLLIFPELAGLSKKLVEWATGHY